MRFDYDCYQQNVFKNHIFNIHLCRRVKSPITRFPLVVGGNPKCIRTGSLSLTWQPKRSHNLLHSTFALTRLDTRLMRLNLFNRLDSSNPRTYRVYHESNLKNRIGTILFYLWYAWTPPLIKMKKGKFLPINWKENLWKKISLQENCLCPERLWEII